MSNARNISKADSRFVNATGDTISGILNNESKVGIKVGSSPDTNLEVATRYSYNYAENMAIKVKNSESGYNNHMYLGSIGSSMIIDGARYYGGGAYLFEDAEASMIQMNNGSIDFHSRTGATAGGSSYSFPKVMGIDNAGRVTMPNQPSFTGTFVGTTNGSTVVFNSVGHNDGNMYNTSTGRFTAPVSGKYLYQAVLLKASGSSTRLDVVINGGTNHNIGQEKAYSTTAGYDQLIVNCVYKLSAGDWIDLNYGGTLNSNGSGSDQYNCLSILLLC